MLRYEILCLTAQKDEAIEEQLVGYVIANDLKEAIEIDRTQSMIMRHTVTNDLTAFAKVRFILREFQNVHEWIWSEATGLTDSAQE